MTKKKAKKATKKPKKVKKKKEFKYEKVYKFLKEGKVAFKKSQICKGTKLSMNSVNYCLYRLKKEKKIGLHRRTYWGIGLVKKD